MRRTAFIRIFISVLFLTSALTSCSRATFAETQGSSVPAILTTSTILADVTRNIAGERLSVGSILSAGADPHSYQLTPQDTARISKSRMLIVNGAGYERFLETALSNIDGQRTLIEASAGLTLRSDTEHGNGTDPHLWLDPNNMIVYVQNIRDGLIQFDPAGTDTYRANAEAYIKQLKDLDTWINEQVSRIPSERKLLVTNHESFGYFAERYGFKVIGTVIESFSSDASPSARQMAALVDQIKQYHAPAIFLDASDNPALAQQIATETGAKVVTDLHLESLTDGDPAGTYIDMMKYDVTKIVEALKE